MMKKQMKELPGRSLGREVLEDWSLGAEGKLREQEKREIERLREEEN